jgi:hypothetical protein
VALLHELVHRVNQCSVSEGVLTVITYAVRLCIVTVLSIVLVHQLPSMVGVSDGLEVVMQPLNHGFLVTTLTNRATACDVTSGGCADVTSAWQNTLQYSRKL